VNDHTKRVVAYIAGRIIGNNDVTTVYDEHHAKYFSFAGDVEPSLAIYDYEQKCFINGSKNQNVISLYHFGNKNNINLELTGSDFVGYDYDSGQRFCGNVNENLVTIYDYENSHNYSYQI
jgi:DNA relaxase NicK